MTNQIKNPVEKEAIDSLNNREYEKAANLFYQLYKTENEDNDRSLTHTCVAVWMGIQNCCITAGRIYICALAGINDSGYASELFISSLFRLKRISSKYTSTLSDDICETVERIENILNYLVSKEKSTYAMSWYANVIRGMALYPECKTFIDNALTEPSLPEGVVNQLTGCRDNIKAYDSDSSEVCHHVKTAFPELPTIDGKEIAVLKILISKIWKEVSGIKEDEKASSPLEPVSEEESDNKVETNVPKINTPLTCKLGFHHWQGCKCTNCGKNRDKFHDFSSDCQKCSICDKVSSTTHSWDGCTCTKCGKIRDVEHKTNGDSTCIVCGRKVKSETLQQQIEGFVKNALERSAFCTVSISDLGTITSDLTLAFMKLGISSSDIPDLFTYSLIAICPKCHDYISGNSLLMLDAFSLSGGGVIFTGNSGGAERLMEGKCKSYSCFSKTYDLYWCPDLDSELLSDIQTRHGLSINRNMQDKRQHIWKPSR